MSERAAVRLVEVLEPAGGGGRMRLVGAFREVRRPERLVYRWRWETGVWDQRESLVTVEFHELGGRTEVVLLHHSFDGPGPVEMYDRGWASGLQKLTRSSRRELRTMPEAANEIVIERPAAEVFAFLADAENDARWRPGVLDIQRVSGSGAGTRYRQGVRGPGGRRVAADIEISEYDPDRSIAFHATAGPVRPRGRYTITRAGSPRRASPAR